LCGKERSKNQKERGKKKREGFKPHVSVWGGEDGRIPKKEGEMDMNLKINQGRDRVLRLPGIETTEKREHSFFPQR